MFEKEEQKLFHYHQQLKELPVPSSAIDDAFAKGIKEAARGKHSVHQFRKKAYFTLAAIAIICISFITSIKISPHFAQAFANLPGMERVVDLITFNKGMKGILSNDYYQVVGATETSEAITFTIDGVIADETGMVIFYTVKSLSDARPPTLKEVQLHHEGNPIPSHVSLDTHPALTHEPMENYMTLTFAEQQTFHSKQFELALTFEEEGIMPLTLPFQLTADIAKGTTYPIHQTIDIEQQKITIHEVVIHPLRAEVSVSYDDTNPMHILQLMDLQLVNENNETWGQIQQGIRSQKQANQEVYYLQSNFFEQPDQLFLKLQTLQALSKTKDRLIIDSINKQVIQQPDSDLLEITSITEDSIEGVLHVPDFHQELFASITNHAGQTVPITTSFFNFEDEQTVFHLSFQPQPNHQPLAFHFGAFPNELKGDARIEVK